MEDCPPKSHWTKHRNLGCLTTARRKMNYNMNKVRIVKDLPCFLGSFSFLNKTKSAKRFWNHRALATKTDEPKHLPWKILFQFILLFFLLLKDITHKKKRKKRTNVKEVSFSDIASVTIFVWLRPGKIYII